MIKARNIHQWLWSSLMVVGLLLLVACADDSSDEQQDNCLRLASVTRADDDPIRLNEGHIKIFVTAKGIQPIDYPYENNGSGWGDAGASIIENTQYFIYGYMPNDGTVVTTGSSLSATDSELGGDYAKGANLTLGGLPIFTTEDICIIVGVKRVTSKITTEDPAAEEPAIEGNYSYLSGLSDQNYVNLLMEHLYMKLQLQFKVKSDYYALRRIHLKSVKLKSTYGKAVNATVKLRKGKGINAKGVDSPVGYVRTEPGNVEYNLLTGDDLELAEAKEGVEATKLSATVNCPHYLFVSNDPSIPSYLTIESTYDVYDTYGNRIRENCTASNKVKVLAQDTGAGIMKTLTLTVGPTYLYMLSEPDLDNPTADLKVEN